jgi:hypothetical protein
MFDFLGDVSRKTKANDLEKRWFDITSINTVIPALYYESVDYINSLSFILTVGFSETNGVNSRYTAGVTILVHGTVGA